MKTGFVFRCHHPLFWRPKHACQSGALHLGLPTWRARGILPSGCNQAANFSGCSEQGWNNNHLFLALLKIFCKTRHPDFTGRLVREPAKNISGGSSGCNFYSVCFPLTKCFWNCCWNKCLFFLIRGTHKATVADLLVSPLLSWDLTLMEPRGCTRPIPLVHTMLGRWADSVSWGDVMKCLWVNVSFKERLV